MRILYIAPLPPPITGHSLAARLLLEHLNCQHDVQEVNLSEGSQHDGTVSLKRILAVSIAIFKVFFAARKSDRIYLTISESIAGNIKDLFLYLVIGRLLDRTVVHLHGGSLGKDVLQRSIVLKWLNKKLLSKVGAVIISGPSHQNIFKDAVHVSRIWEIPNFAQDKLFVDEQAIEKKFYEKNNAFRILYLSGMTDGKGYKLLVKAYHLLDKDLKNCIQLDFAGMFDNQKQAKEFCDNIAAFPKIKYHGVVNEYEKVNLFKQAHVFVLPTSFMEGQPISILEAYASGCAVLTTPQPGILDIFKPDLNGYLISFDDPVHLSRTIADCYYKRNFLRKIAINNHRSAKNNFRQRIFNDRVESVLASVIKS